MRGMIMKSSVTCARLPICSRTQNSSIVDWVCSTSVPNNEFFLSPSLSSMITAEAPSRSSDRTVNTKCSGFPPVSPSKIKGFVVVSKISPIVCSRELISTASMSGFPRAVESVNDDPHIPSNSTWTPSRFTEVDSTMSPVRPLCTSRMRTRSLLLSRRRRRESRTFGVVPTCFTASFSSVEEMPSV